MLTAILLHSATIIVTIGLSAAATYLVWRQCTLGLRTRVDALELEYTQLHNQLVREIKRRSGEEGLEERARRKKNIEEARNLLTEKNVHSQSEIEPPWWETEKSKVNG